MNGRRSHVDGRKARSAASPEPILEIGAEGGSIRVYARKGAQGSHEFRVATSEWALDEPEAAGSESDWLPNWEAAVAHMSRYPWPNLYPVSVHRDWRAQVIQAVKLFRDWEGRPVRESSLDRWRSMCELDDEAG
jgi:hypothetical protein